MYLQGARSMALGRACGGLRGALRGGARRVASGASPAAAAAATTPCAALSGGARSSSSSSSSGLKAAAPLTAPAVSGAVPQPRRAALTAARCAGAGGHHHHATVAAAAVEQDADNQQPQTFTITTPLYYVNAAPHMGSAYPTIAADALARFQRMRGRDVRFVTGTDEHGEKIALAAAARGMSPKEHCDDVARAYEDLWAKVRALPCCVCCGCV